MQSFLKINEINSYKYQDDNRTSSHTNSMQKSMETTHHFPFQIHFKHKHLVNLFHCISKFNVYRLITTVKCHSSTCARFILSNSLVYCTFTFSRKKKNKLKKYFTLSHTQLIMRWTNKRQKVPNLNRVKQFTQIDITIHKSRHHLNHCRCSFRTNKFAFFLLLLPVFIGVLFSFGFFSNI